MVPLSRVSTPPETHLRPLPRQWSPLYYSRYRTHRNWVIFGQNGDLKSRSTRLFNRNDEFEQDPKDSERWCSQDSLNSNDCEKDRSGIRRRFLWLSNSSHIKTKKQYQKWRRPKEGRRKKYVLGWLRITRWARLTDWRPRSLPVYRVRIDYPVR